MNGSFRIATVAGIGIFLHWTFLLLLGWISYQHLAAGDGWQGAVVGVAFVVAIFGCIVLHELGHALAARGFGIPTRDITLLPIGGVARLERIPADPLQEFVVAIAGPAVNVVIILLLTPIVMLTVGFQSTLEIDPLHDNFTLRLLLVNVILVLFNLLPAFPMDGGRVLRAVLAAMLDRGLATRIAAGVGQVMAVLFAILAVVTQQWMLLLVAVFVFAGAYAEVRSVATRDLFRGFRVRDAMTTRFLSLHPDDPVERAVAEARHGLQEDFPIAIGAEVKGMLFGRDLRKAIAADRGQDRVGELMSSVVPIVPDDLPLEQAVDRLQHDAVPALLVSHGERLVGMLTGVSMANWFVDRRRAGTDRQAVSANSDSFDHTA